MKNIVILGATGSIGTQTLDVVRRLPERLRVVGLSAHRNEALLRQQAREFDVPAAALEWGDGADLVRLARMPEADIVVVAVAGAVGMQATLAALEAGKDVALATKEVLVAAGELVMAAAKANGVRVLPIDSEHSAVFQCLQGSPEGSVAKLWLTASGGPFREWTAEQMARATLADALHHPTWPTMGRKITVDSATLMNKGLETIEASLALRPARWNKSASSSIRRAWYIRWWSFGTGRCWHSWACRTCACPSSTPCSTRSGWTPGCRAWTSRGWGRR